MKVEILPLEGTFQCLKLFFESTKLEWIQRQSHYSNIRAYKTPELHETVNLSPACPRLYELI